MCSHFPDTDTYTQAHTQTQTHTISVSTTVGGEGESSFAQLEYGIRDATSAKWGPQPSHLELDVNPFFFLFPLLPRLLTRMGESWKERQRMTDCVLGLIVRTKATGGGTFHANYQANLN